MPSIKFCFRIHIGFHWLGIFVIAQLAPSFFGALFWKEDQKMVLQGIIIGFQFVVIHF
jgi:Na+/proline symporter